MAPQSVAKELTWLLVVGQGCPLLRFAIVGASDVHRTFARLSMCLNQASFVKTILQGGAGKALDPPPLIILRVSVVGLLPHLLPLVTGALSCCLLVPFSGLSLCGWQVCRWQFFRWRTFFFHSILNLWTFCCTKLSELVHSPVVKVLDSNSNDPWSKSW